MNPCKHVQAICNVINDQPVVFDSDSSMIVECTTCNLYVCLVCDEDDHHLICGSVVASYDKQFGDDRICVCGHPYHRHFDSYDGMRPVGCKYCRCKEFVEEDKTLLETVAARVLAMVNQRGWSIKWADRGVYLHLEITELAYAIRRCQGDILGEAADVLLVLMSITESNHIRFNDVIRELEQVDGRPSTQDSAFTELHAAASDLVEALRGKRDSAVPPAGRVLYYLKHLTEPDLTLHAITLKCQEKVAQLEQRAPYEGEEKISGAVHANP